MVLPYRPVFSGSFLCQVNRYLSNFIFRLPAFFTGPLHHMPVTVARGKIHPAVYIVSIFRQYLFHDTHAFHKITPISCFYKPDAFDAIANGNLVGRLFLVFNINELFRCLSFLV